MNRRDFIQQGAIGTVAVTAAGCGAGLAQQQRPMLALDHGRDIVARLDSSLAHIENLRFLSGEVGRDRIAQSSSVRRYLEHAEPMAKRAVQSLVVAGAAKEIPPDHDVPDEVRRAFAQRVPLLDRHVLETTALFARMPLQDRRRMGRMLRDDPELPMRVAERIDQLGRGIDVSPVARLNLQHAAREVSFRMSKQPPSAFMDDQVRKVERVCAVRGLDAQLARLIATNATTSAILQQVAGGGGTGVQAEGELDAPVPQPPPQLVEVPQPEPEEQDRTPETLMVVGGILLGVGAVLLGVMIPLTVLSADSGLVIAGAFGITAGGLLTIGGIICLIIGAAMS